METKDLKLQVPTIINSIKRYREYEVEFNRNGHDSEIYIQFLHTIENLDADCDTIDIIREIIEKLVKEDETNGMIVNKLIKIFEIINDKRIEVIIND